MLICYAANLQKLRVEFVGEIDHILEVFRPRLDKILLPLVDLLVQFFAHVHKVLCFLNSFQRLIVGVNLLFYLAETVHRAMQFFELLTGIFHELLLSSPFSRGGCYVRVRNQVEFRF